MDDATAALFPDNLEKWVQLIERPTAETLIGKRVLMIGDGYRAKNSELGIPGVPFVRGGDLLQGRITPTKDFLAMTALSGARGKAAKSGDTAFTSKGTIGRFAFVDSSAGEAVYSPQVCFWRSLNQDYLDPIYLHFWMKSLAFTSQVAAVCGQAAIMDFVSLSDQRKMILDIPLTALQARFANAVKPLLERISVNRATDECLSELRDTLLPRLISGQLRLPEAEEALAEAVA
jgi:type I restriction enzyme S subunit